MCSLLSLHNSYFLHLFTDNYFRTNLTPEGWFCHGSDSGPISLGIWENLRSGVHWGPWHKMFHPQGIFLSRKLLNDHRHLLCLKSETLCLAGGRSNICICKGGSLKLCFANSAVHFKLTRNIGGIFKEFSPCFSGYITRTLHVFW